MPKLKGIVTKTYFSLIDVLEAYCQSQINDRFSLNPPKGLFQYNDFIVVCGRNSKKRILTKSTLVINKLHIYFSWQRLKMLADHKVLLTMVGSKI